MSTKDRSTLEAMKMETTLYAEWPAWSPKSWSRAGTQVDTGDLLLRFKG
jgi:hypothetical protein